MADMLRDFINDHCIVRCPPGYFLKGSGNTPFYSWQFYLRNAIYFQPALYHISVRMNAMFDNKFQYAAMESAGPPILTSIQTLRACTGDTTDLVTFAIRKDQKRYGLMNWFEGAPVLDKPVVLIDDISNSKSTLTRAKSICESFDLVVDHAISIVDKKGMSDVNGLPVKSLFSIDDFDLEWAAYYKNREAPTLEEFEQRYKNVLHKLTVDGIMPIS